MRAIVSLLFFVMLLFSSKTYKVVEINDNLLTLDTTTLKVGESALVVREYESNSIILSYASAINKSQVKLFKYTNLAQDSFPIPTLDVKKGDSVIFGLYNTRRLLIAPNKKAYHTHIKNSINSYIHIDLLAVLLSDNGQINPTKEYFKQIAQQYSIGKIEFIIEEKLYIVDAQSFIIIDTKEIIPNKDESMIPFYHRLEEIDKGLFNFDDNMSNYSIYYKKLLGVK